MVTKIIKNLYIVIFVEENNTEYSSEIISDLDLESESDQNIDIN